MGDLVADDRGVKDTHNIVANPCTCFRLDEETEKVNAGISDLFPWGLRAPSRVTDGRRHEEGADGENLCVWGGSRERG